MAQLASYVMDYSANTDSPHSDFLLEIATVGLGITFAASFRSKESITVATLSAIHAMLLESCIVIPPALIGWRQFGFIHLYNLGGALQQDGTVRCTLKVVYALTPAIEARDILSCDHVLTIPMYRDQVAGLLVRKTALFLKEAMKQAPMILDYPALSSVSVLGFSYVSAHVLTLRETRQARSEFRDVKERLFDGEDEFDPKYAPDFEDEDGDCP